MSSKIDQKGQEIKHQDYSFKLWLITWRKGPVAADAAAAAMAAAVATGLLLSIPPCISRPSSVKGVTTVGWTSFFTGLLWSCLMVQCTKRGKKKKQSLL